MISDTNFLTKFELQLSAADLAKLEVTTTTVTTEKSKAPLARPEEVGS